MTAYYNEFDPFAAAWLRELIKDGLIADGVVDERSITEVEPNDIKGFTQCHFFAGIGGWSLAARLAGWSDDRPMWTGSPPCQPFSVAGNKKGKDDLRHLWPVFFNLIRECKPSVVFGEQVASAIRHGWFDDLRTDMEKEGYAAGMVVLPACSVNAPHKRDRLWYVAERLAATSSKRLQRSKLARSDIKQNEKWGESASRSAAECRNDNSTLGNTEHDGSHGIEVGRGASEAGYNDTQGQDISIESKGAGRSYFARDLCDWKNSGYVYCRDNKIRPVPTEPALFPLANGLPNRVGVLRGAGNAIVPQVAAEVIKAYMEF